MTKRSIELEGGKYRIVEDDSGMRAFRHGAPWRDLTGDKMVSALLDTIAANQHALDKATPWRVEEMGPHFRKLHLSIGGWDLQLHHFSGPDTGEPHDHPFAFTTSILAGGYEEEVWTPGDDHQWVKQIVQRLPGTTHRVEAGTVHRIVRLLEHDSCITSVIWHASESKRREPCFWKPWETPTLVRQWDWKEWKKVVNT